MDITKTSSAEETENTENNTSHAQNLHENVSKFYDTIENISRNLRKDDWTYLQRHPEIRAIIRVITAEAIKAQPSNIYQFTADLFASERDEEMVEKINKQLKWLGEQLRGGTWNSAEGCAQFPESSETSETKCPTPTENLNIIEKQVCPENYKPDCKKC
ncbi:uncharacterized protein LOC6546834 [Drosophila erecta]|uniref:Uncharacterized protein n=1 Tax=Drosophila erecta TaxID=7220 RepID=B3NS39_DROER|nr:uncharacterized protein LOC6546834 [Drosophila erecta]EDV56341.1 uncharacterized protein Dere_GG20276 [Drosophila erecta]